VIAAPSPIDVVYFAGAGGSSEAYRIALGKHPDVALNHKLLALAVHQLNFPETEHIAADVFDVDPRSIRPGRKWRSFWASPDCSHFSKAKGGAPVSPRVRGLAWVVIKVAKLLGENRPDVIFLENVEEFADWAPLILGDDGELRPDPKHKGKTFRLFVKRLRQCGYVVEWRLMVAADYGAPTKRKRLFLVARCDGLPIVWPAPTHAPRQVAASKGLKPWRAAAEIIDWSRPCPSIFLSPQEAKALRVKRPLEAATLARIAKGVQRYVIGCADPFIVPVTHSGTDRVHDIREPLRTITSAHRGEMALVAPSLVGTAHGEFSERPGVRAWSVEDPLRTVSGSSDRAVASVFLTKFSENSVGHLPDEPLHTVMAGAPRHGLVAAFFSRQFGKSVGSDGAEPIGAITAGGGGKTSLVTAFVEQANTGMVGRDAREPLSTTTARGTQQRVVTACLSHAYSSNTCGGEGDPREPAKTVTAGGNHHYVLQMPLERPFADRGDELRAFLVKYYGSATAADLADPLHSVTSRARFGLVVVSGQVLQIADIGMRMLTPDELKGAQGFGPHYVTNRDAFGRKVTKTDETLLIGNSVSPINGAALIAANLGNIEPARAAA
jgi:DNA (cytosine-5)-methyltransferase 1